MSVDGWTLINIQNDVLYTNVPEWGLPLLFAGGFVLLFVTLHVARGIGRLHGSLAKHLLVKSSQ
jgi:hypothetical protein